MKHFSYKNITLIILLFLDISYGAEITYSVSGVKGKLYDSIINSLSSTEKTEAANPQIQYLNNIYTIKSLAKPYGYFFVKVKPQLRKKNNIWYADYEISLGNKIKVTSVATIATSNKISLPSDIIKKDDDFTLLKYQSSKDNILASAKAQGYPDARIANSRANIDLERKTCHIVFNLELGDFHQFGEISYDNNKVSKKFLNKFAPFVTGDIFDKSKIATFKKNLEASGLFSQVNVISENTKNTMVPIKVSLELKPKKEYLVGLGFDTDEYVRGLFEMTNNLSMEYGHTSKAYLEASASELEMGFKYYIPGSNPVVDKYIYSIYLDTKHGQKVGTSNYIAASAIKSKKYNFLTHTYSFNLHYEKSAPDEANSYYSTVLYPKSSVLYYDHNDKNEPYTIKSKMLSWYALASAKAAGSTLNMLKSEINANMNYNITRNTGIYAKIQLGGILTDNFEDMPLTFQFTAGGSNSLRGYSYNSIGPNKVIELLNLELHHKIYDNWYVMLFYDIGNTFSEFKMHDLKIGTGPGILWKTPVGDAKLALAQAITENSKPWSIQFSFNPVL